MSRIVGVVNLDGAPVDPTLLQALAESCGRGLDAVGVEANGQVGLGHALLRTTDESERERQPSSLDEDVWITADARVDGRTDLVRELVASDTHPVAATDLDAATDDTLLLHAYHAWGERCVEHLLGDFAFAIWDGRRRRLFCARDQLGVKPFFYAIAGDCLIFASELDCVRAHPAVPADLDDLAIADFLLWGQNQELDTTVFAAIRRLPPAHTLTWAGDRPQINRYWELSVPAETRYPQPDDYVERFNELLREAVGDRLRTNRVGVLMSGGLDSPLIAATARSELARQQRGFALRAHTVIYESLIPDEERRYAGIAGDALGIPVDYLAADRYPLFAGWDEPAWTTPEPSEPTSYFAVDLMRAVATHSRVALTGFDGDTLCQLWLPSHFRGLLESLRFKRALFEAGWFMLARRSLPPVGFRARLRQRRERGHPAPGFPPWMNPELVARLDLRPRWQRFAAPQRPPGRHVRADAVQLLSGPTMSWLFDHYDPACTRSQVMVRHPLLDLRMVSYVLSLPPIPWCVDKTILRKAARGALPATIHRRPKAPLAEDPARALVRQSGGLSTREPGPSAALTKYVDIEALLPLHAAETSGLLWPRLRASSLEQWLSERGPEQ